MGVEDPNPPPSVIQDGPSDVRALQSENRSLRRRLDQMRGGEALIIDAVRQSWEDPPDLVVPTPPKTTNRKLKETAVLHVTDTQIGKLTESYSTAVADQRLMRIVDKVHRITETRRSSASVKECVLLLGGDMVEGENIFPGQAHHIDTGLFEQACKTAPSIFVRLILGLLQTFDSIRVYAVCGNHGRAASRSIGSHPKTNWDRVCYQITRDILLGTPDHPRTSVAKRLSFDIADDFYVIAPIYDWRALMVHGDQIRGGFAGFPWYGAAKKAWGWIDAIPDEWDYLYFGHFHQMVSAVLNFREFFCGGTPESGNAYAVEQLAAVGHPMQRLQFFNAEHGMISDHRIYLDEGQRVPQVQRRGGSRNG